MNSPINRYPLRADVGRQLMEKTVRIAYLEDDMAQAELVTHWLKEAGHNCIHLASGREFMSLLRRDTFDILVLDWEVPDMNGYAVLEDCLLYTSDAADE